MTFTKSHLILGILFVMLVCSTVAVSTTNANAGPTWGGGFLGVTTMDLGSTR